MSGRMSTSDVLKSLGLEGSNNGTKIIEAAGVLPTRIKDVSVVDDRWVLGIKPEDFVAEFSSQALDFGDLCAKFKVYCHDFDDALAAGTASKALDFSSKILFEIGPMMRTERKSKGDKAVRFRFPYKSTRPEVGTDGKPKQSIQLEIGTVIVSTFKDTAKPNLIEDNKMIITIKQATLLAMVTFCKACDYAYNQDANVLLTPLCGAIFSRDSIRAMSKDLEMEPTVVIRTLNCSTSPHGHHLADSDLACAIVATISATKGMSTRGARDQMITKVIKQYTTKGKEYNAKRFAVFAEHALGGVPPGLEAASLMENYQNLQTAARIKRTKQKAPGSDSVGSKS